MTPETLAITPQERTQTETQGQSVLTEARGLVVHDADTFAKAAAWLREVVVPFKRAIAETFRPRIDQAHQLHKGLLADERRFLEPVEAAERLVRGQLATWEQAESRRREEAARVAQRERERQEAEARAVAEAETRRLQAEAETRQLEEAAALEAQGDRTGAAKLIEVPVEVIPVAPVAVFAPRPPVAAAPRVEGVSFRDTYTAEVFDLMALVRAVATGLAPITLLQVNTTALNGMARALKNALALPGVRVISGRVAAVRS